MSTTGTRPPGRLYLASGSPRRHRLIKLIHPQPVVVHSAYDEPPLPGTLPRPAGHAKTMALNKARHAVLPRKAKGWVLGADTLVHLDGRAFGKPASLADARRMLQTLAGKRHTVITGVALVHPTGGEHTAHATTHVTFRPLTPREINAYLALGEWTDKAGAYAAQGAGACLIEKVNGCWTNVVGLPVATTLELLARTAKA